MKIIDSHVHFWHPDKLRYTWLDDLPILNRPYLPDDYREAIGDIDVSGVVFVQADCLPQQGFDEAKWVASLGEPVAGIVAFAALEKGDAVRPELDALKDVAQVVGIRRLIQSESMGFSIQPDFIKGVQALTDYDLPFDICIYHHQLSDIIELVRQCPDVRFILDHCGKPDIASGLLDPWRENIRTLAGFENVSCKISGLVTEVNHDSWTVDDLRPYIEHVVESFGIGRVSYGSDWSVVNLAGDYQSWWEAQKSILNELSTDEQIAFYSKNTTNFYGLNTHAI